MGDICEYSKKTRQRTMKLFTKTVVHKQAWYFGMRGVSRLWGSAVKNKLPTKLRILMFALLVIPSLTLVTGCNQQRQACCSSLFELQMIQTNKLDDLCARPVARPEARAHCLWKHCTFMHIVNIRLISPLFFPPLFTCLSVGRSACLPFSVFPSLPAPLNLCLFPSSSLYATAFTGRM